MPMHLPNWSSQIYGQHSLIQCGTGVLDALEKMRIQSQMSSWDRDLKMNSQFEFIEIFGFNILSYRYPLFKSNNKANNIWNNEDFLVVLTYFLLNILLFDKLKFLKVLNFSIIFA